MYEQIATLPDTADEVLEALAFGAGIPEERLEGAELAAHDGVAAGILDALQELL